MDKWLNVLPYAIAIVAYVLGKVIGRKPIPKSVRKLLADPAVMDAVLKGIEAAGELAGKSDAEKKDYARQWIREELQRLLGIWLPDSVVNYLIEHVIVTRKE